MISVYLADCNAAERNTLRLLIHDLKMNLVGEAEDWPTVLAQVPINCPQMVVVDWDVLPISQNKAVVELRNLCLPTMVIVLISHLDPFVQSAISVGAAVFISRGEKSEQVVERFRSVVKRFSP